MNRLLTCCRSWRQSWRPLVGAALALCLPGFALAQTCVHPQGNVALPLWGDVNGGGSVNVADAVCGVLVAVAYTLNPSNPALPGCCGGEFVGSDADCDGTVDISDVLLIIRSSLGAALSPSMDGDEDGCPDGCVGCVPANETSCLIDANCYGEEVSSPTEACLVCRPSLDDGAWSVRDDGDPCGGGKICASATCEATYPGAPTITGVSAGDGSLTVSFAAPASNGGDPVIEYTADCVDGAVSHVQSGALSPVVVSGLANGALHSCVVTATNGVGDGPASEPAGGTPFGLPSAPPSVSASPDVESIVVSFGAAAPNGAAVTGYTVGCTPVGSSTELQTSGAGSPLTVTGAQSGTNYTCRARATNAAGDGPWSPPTGAVTPSPSFALPSFPAGQIAIVMSNSAAVSGGGSTSASISGTGSPQFQVNGGSWTTSASVSSGQTIRLRFSAAVQANSSYSGTFTLGADSWPISYSTGNPCPGGSSLHSSGRGCRWQSSGTYSVSWQGPETIYARMWGAGGGSTTGTYGTGSGGGGGFTQGQASYSGQSLTVIVGGGGTAGGGTDSPASAYGRGGHGGGGDGGSHSVQKLQGQGAGGGGRSAVQRAGSEILTAGGGGGGYPYSASVNKAGAGGGTAAQDGQDGPSYGSGGGGHGGTTSGGGAGGLDPAPCGGGNGTQFQGGKGGSGPGSGSNNSYGAGGGGGGYYGGGGGSAHGNCGFRWGGAGGGSGYVGGSGVSGSTSTGNYSTPAGTGDADYVGGVGVGNTSGGTGGSGLVVLRWAP